MFRYRLAADQEVEFARRLAPAHLLAVKPDVATDRERAGVGMASPKIVRQRRRLDNAEVERAAGQPGHHPLQGGHGKVLIATAKPQARGFPRFGKFLAEAGNPERALAGARGGKDFAVDKPQGGMRERAAVFAFELAQQVFLTVRSIHMAAGRKFALANGG